MKRERFVLVLAAIVLSACHANYYSTPRTVPKGKTAHIVAVHAEPWPFMVYEGRVGLADRVDVGLHASLYFNKLDLKYNFLRTKYFDMAINPGVSFGLEPITEQFRWKGWLPLMLGLNLGPRVTLMAQGGPVLMQYSAPHANDLSPTIMGAVGGGVQIRVTELFYIQPEFSINYMKYSPAGTFFWPNFGIGFGFGPQPRYDDEEKKK